MFKTVGVDAAYYDFPRREYLHKLADAVPDDFQFGFKVTDAITVKKFPNLPRFGVKAGQTNRDFLNADVSATAFLNLCEEIRSKVGVLMFEFSRFCAPRTVTASTGGPKFCNASATRTRTFARRCSCTAVARGCWNVCRFSNTIRTGPKMF